MTWTSHLPGPNIGYRIKIEIFQNAIKYSPQKRTSGTYKTGTPVRGDKARTSYDFQVLSPCLPNTPGEARIELPGSKHLVTTWKARHGSFSCHLGTLISNSFNGGGALHNSWRTVLVVLAPIQREWNHHKTQLELKEVGTYKRYRKSFHQRCLYVLSCNFTLLFSAENGTNMSHEWKSSVILHSP